MAETVHLYLKIRGVAITGDDETPSIKCVYLRLRSESVRAAGRGIATGRRQHEPLVIRKHIDKSSPLLARALTTNEVIDAEFKFFRQPPAGDISHFYSVLLKGARVSAISPAAADANSTSPPDEQVAFVFHTITWSYVDPAVSFTSTAARTIGVFG